MILQLNIAISHEFPFHPMFKSGRVSFAKEKNSIVSLATKTHEL